MKDVAIRAKETVVDTRLGTARNEATESARADIFNTILSYPDGGISVGEMR